MDDYPCCFLGFYPIIITLSWILHAVVWRIAVGVVDVARMAHITALGVFILGLVLLTEASQHQVPGRNRGSPGDECQNVLEHFSAAKIGPSSIVPKQRIHGKRPVGSDP